MKSIIDMLVSAFHSSHLSDGEGERDITRIGAAGLASRSQPLAMAIYELKYRLPADGLMSSSRMAPVLLRLGHEVRRECKRQRWQMRRGRDCDDVALFALQWWLQSVCPACDGLRYALIDGTQRLSDRYCVKCNGEGRFPLPDAVRVSFPLPMRSSVFPAVRWTVDRLDSLEGIAGNEYLKRLGRQFDVGDNPWVL